MSNKILYLLGVQDNNQATVNYHDGSFNCQLEGNVSLYGPLEPANTSKDFFVYGGAQKVKRQVPFEHFVRASNILFNCVSDADSNSAVLGQLAKVLPAFGLPVINPPSAVLSSRREQVCRLGIDIQALQFPRTCRVSSPRDSEDVLKALDESGISFPFIVRRVGTHGGASVKLIRRFGELKLLNTIGYDGGDLYLIEFVDYVDDDGYYRKLRLVVVDGQVFARHQIVSNQWMIHAGSRDILMEQEEKFRVEERHVLANFKDILGERRCAAVAQLFKRTGLDFMGVDCNVRPDGRLLVFEANSSMNIFAQNNPRVFPYLEAASQAIKTAMEAMIVDRLAGRVR